MVRNTQPHGVDGHKSQHRHRHQRCGAAHPARAHRRRVGRHHHTPPEHQPGHRQRQRKVSRVEQRDVRQRVGLARRPHRAHQRAHKHQRGQRQRGVPVIGLGMRITRPGKRSQRRLLVGAPGPHGQQQQHGDGADQQHHTGPRAVPERALVDPEPQHVGDQHGQQPDAADMQRAGQTDGYGGVLFVTVPQHPVVQHQHHRPDDPGREVQHMVAHAHLPEGSETHHHQGGTRGPAGHGPLQPPPQQEGQGRRQHQHQHGQQLGGALAKHRHRQRAGFERGCGACHLQQPGQAPEHKTVEVERARQLAFHVGIQLRPA